MRAVAVFPDERAIRMIDHPEPTIEDPFDVRVQMLEVGICGTDREIASFDYGTPPSGSPYLIIGHESLAQVIDVGPAVTRARPGDMVVMMVRRPCSDPTCRACPRGRQDFCFTGGFSERGIKGRHGFMTERVVDRERFVHVVPAHLKDVAVLVEPLTIAEKALIQVWDVQERLPWTAPGTPAGDGHGQRAVVLGAGPVGLLGVLALRSRGFDTVVYSLETEDSPKARWAASVGASYVSSAVTPIQTLSDRIGSIDLIYEATGAASLSFQALEMLGTNGVFIFTGVPGRKGPISVDADLLMRNVVLKNQLVFGTVNAGPDAFHAAVDDLARFHVRWPDALAALITSRSPLDTFRDLLVGPSEGIKRVVNLTM